MKLHLSNERGDRKMDVLRELDESDKKDLEDLADFIVSLVKESLIKKAESEIA
jgi:hypothetical protein